MDSGNKKTPAAPYCEGKIELDAYKIDNSPSWALLEPAFGLGLEFIKLHHPFATKTKVNGKDLQLGKAPVASKWTTISAGSEEDAREWVASGHNVGVRLLDCDLVIDVDPRNGGDIDALEKFLAIDLRNLFPYVVTGSNGLRLYIAKPAELQIATSLAGFPGMEFETRSTQVVAPGSVHPETGQHYAVDALG